MAIQYAGGTNINATFTGNVKNDILTNVESNLIAAGWTLVQGNVPATVTVTIASPAVVSWTSHGLVAGTRITFSTTGVLPTGITAGTVYFVIAAGNTTNAFEFSTTLGGSAVNTSGSQSGTHTGNSEILMQSATTSWSVATRIRFRDNGSGFNCVVFSVENSTSSLAGANGASNGGYLLPAASKTFRVVASQYQAFIFQPITTTVRSYVAFGTPYIPSFLSGSITECGWMSGSSNGDTDTTLRTCWRNSLAEVVGTHQGIVNGNLLDAAVNNTGGPGGLQLVYPTVSAGFGTGQTGWHWSDASAMMFEPLVMWANTSVASGEALIRGQLWDCALVMDTFTGDTTSTFDSHNWITLTDGNTTQKGTLLLVTP